jgi:hypothetical protein
VLVVVGVVPRVAVDPVQVVVVIRMRHGGVAARWAVDVHVADVGDMRAHPGRLVRHVVDVIFVCVVHAAVVQEVDVVTVWQQWMTTEPVVQVGMLGGLEVGAAGGVGTRRVSQGKDLHG